MADHNGSSAKAPENHTVRYVEVPVIEEVVRRVPVKRVVEVEKIVPRQEIEYVERFVEVPQIQYVDRHVEVPWIQETVRYVPKREVVEIPREVVREVPRTEHLLIEKIVQVPGPIVEVPKPYVVEKPIPVEHYLDHEIPVVVSQTVQPVVVPTATTIDVDVFEYEPIIQMIDVYVPKPVPSVLIPNGLTNIEHRPVVVPATQFNSILTQLNPHLQSNPSALPFMKDQPAEPVPSMAQVSQRDWLPPPLAELPYRDLQASRPMIAKATTAAGMPGGSDYLQASLEHPAVPSLPKFGNSDRGSSPRSNQGASHHKDASKETLLWDTEAPIRPDPIRAQREARYRKTGKGQGEIFVRV